MIEVLTPAESTRLTTVEAVRQRYGIFVAEMDDAAINRLIDTASRLAVDYCGRQFGREKVKETLNPYRPVRAIVLGRSPATIESVTYGDVVLLEDDYYHVAESGLLMLDPSGTPAWAGRIELIYSAGWTLPGEENADLPPTIEAAVLMLVGALWSLGNREPGVKSEDVQGLGRTDYWMPGAASALPDPNAEQFLQPYRRF
jgi:hypothetical protein